MPENEIAAIRTELKRITDALLGDPDMGTRGMVCRLEGVETTVNAIQQERRDEKAERKGAWRLAALLSTMAGSFGALVVEYWKRAGK